MDETTKVIIATLSGFIIAFFAEPIKSYFTKRTKLRDMKIALYKEMWSNYLNCISMLTLKNKDEPTLDALIMTVEDSVRMECFQHVLKNETVAFYQLKNATDIDALYQSLILLVKFTKSESYDKGMRIGLLFETAKGYCGNFASAFYLRALDRSFLKTVMNKRDFAELLEHGSEMVKNGLGTFKNKRLAIKELMKR